MSDVPMNDCERCGRLSRLCDLLKGHCEGALHQVDGTLDQIAALSIENERLKAELADANQRLARDRAAAKVINESIDYLKRQERAVVPPWTTESPTVPGRYWMREPAAVLAEIVDVVSFYVPGGGNLLAFWGEAKERRINHFAPGTLWSGPIPEPPARKPVSAGQETP